MRDDAPLPVPDGDTAAAVLAAIVPAVTYYLDDRAPLNSHVAKSRQLSLRRPSRAIALLIAGWVGVAWLTVQYYHRQLDSTLYQGELQLANRQAEEIAGNIDQDIELLKGISLMVSRDPETYRALRQFGADVASSPLAQEARIQRWTRDKGLADLNDSLNVTANSLGADLIFIINSAGDCIAASMAGKPGTPVGSNYADRVYFPRARAGQPGHQYAVGRTTNVPGLYYAHPVFAGGRFLGAAVVKRNITKFSRWTNSANAFLADANGVIVLTPDKQLALHALPGASVASMTAETKNLQYKQSTIEPLAMTPWEAEQFPSAVLIGDNNPPVVLVSKSMPDAAIDIYVPRPLSEVLRLDAERGWIFFLFAGIGSLSIVAVAAFILYVRESRARRLAARKNEEHVRLLLNSAAEGIFGVDIHGQCTFVNAACLGILGYQDTGEIIGRNVHELMHHSRADGTPYPAPECRMCRADQYQEKMHDDEDVFWRRDGSSFAVERWSYPIVSDGQVIGAVVTFFDITERKRTEEALHEATRQIDDLYQNAPCGYHSLDGHGNLVRINDTELQWLGYARTEILGEKPFGDFLTKESRRRFESEFSSRPMRAGEIREIELEYVRKDQSILPVLISTSALFDQHGQFVRSRATVLDLTEHKQREVQRSEQAKRIEALSHRLVSLHEEETRRLAAELHDRTSGNLAALGTYLKRIENNLPKPLPDNLYVMLTDTRAILEDTTNSVRDICSDLRPPILDYAGLLPALESHVERYSRQTGIAVRFESSSPAVPLDAQTETMLFRIVHEALTNCSKHAQASEVSVVLGQSEGGRTTLSIAANGVGFDDQALRRNGSTPGLGLLNMQERAEFVGAELVIESAPKQGTRITVRL